MNIEAIYGVLHVNGWDPIITQLVAYRSRREAEERLTECAEHRNGCQLMRAPVGAFLPVGVADIPKSMSARYDQLLTQTGTPHDHRERVQGCFRCDLSEVEARAAVGAADTPEQEQR